MSLPLSKEEAFARLGAITREMHEAFAVLGSNQLSAVAGEIPDARERLAYVGKMTENAANKVLTLVETAKPECDDLATRGLELAQSLNKMAQASDLTVERARGLLVACGKFAERSAKFSSEQSAALSDIMMAQDFQDLSGQVIKRVIDIITRTETQLVRLLMESSPQAEAMVAAAPAAQEAVTVDTHKLEGPQTGSNAMAQSEVDDLLASMGF
jgi:chemotaxis protein CheZ